MSDARRDAMRSAGAGAFTERPGATLGRYELLVPIASGGMAHVWAARLVGHGGFTKIVALKTMLPQMLEDPQFEAMFLDEARIAAKLRHPNVCETFDLGEDEGVLYLAMEWVDGPSLLRLTHPDGRTCMPIRHRLAAHIVSEACAGLHAAHELLDDDGTPLGVIHRDVSPHNILLSSAGAVKLTDFGVAQARGKTYSTQTGELKGKVAYMSPEQLEGLVPIDRRSDVFGLGCVLYEITTGRRPFEADGDGAVVHRILNAKALRPREVVPTFPPDLESIIMTAIGHHPDERFSTADEMRVALGVYLDKREPITASDVAQLVGERYATDGDDRRERIRLACAQRGSHPSYSDLPPPSSRPLVSMAPVSSAPVSKKPYSFKPTSFTPQIRTTPSSSPQLPTSSTPHSFAPTSSGAISIRPPIFVAAPTPPARARPLVPVLLGGLAMITVLGAGGWYMGKRPALPPVVVVRAPAETAPTPLPKVSVTPSVRTAPGRVTFHVIPKNALMLVDGVLMPAGVDAIERPGNGTRRVMFRAEKFEDYVEVVDTSTPAMLDIVLLPQGASVRRPVVRRPARPTTSASSSALPNPYEE